MLRYPRSQNRDLGYQVFVRNQTVEDLFLRMFFRLVLRSCLVLLRSRLMLLGRRLMCLWRSLMLLWCRLMRLRGSLVLLRRCLMCLLCGVVLLWCGLVLLRYSLMLLRCSLMLLGRKGLIVRLKRGRWLYVAIGSQRFADDGVGRTAMIDTRKLCPVGAGKVLVLDLSPHGRRMFFVQSSYLRWPGAHLYTAGSTVEAHVDVTVVYDNRVVVDVVHHIDVDVVDRAVVIEVASTPVAALIAAADIAKAVVDTAVVANMRAPVAPIVPIAVVAETPIAGCPQGALVGSLSPDSGNPVVAGWSVGPVAGRPQVAVSWSRRLLVVWQRRRRLGSVSRRLHAVARVIRSLVGALVAATIASRRLGACVG